MIGTAIRRSTYLYALCMTFDICLYYERGRYGGRGDLYVQKQDDVDFLEGLEWVRDGEARCYVASY